MFERQVHELYGLGSSQGFNAALVNTVGTLPGPEVAIGLDIPFVWAIHESWTPRVIWSVIHPPPRRTSSSPAKGHRCARQSRGGRI